MRPMRRWRSCASSAPASGPKALARGEMRSAVEDITEDLRREILTSDRRLPISGEYMSSHAFALGLTVFAYRMAARYARDRRFAFGTWKIEVLAGFAGGTADAFTLFERFEAPRPIGSGLMIQPAGLAVLRALGLAETLQGQAARVERLYGRAGARGPVVLDVRYRALGQGGGFGLGVHRATLFDTLHRAAQAEGLAIEKAGLASRSRAMVGSATLAIVVSSACMRSMELGPTSMR